MLLDLRTFSTNNFTATHGSQYSCFLFILIISYGVPYVSQHNGRVRVRDGQVNKISSAVSGAVYSNWSQDRNCFICYMSWYLAIYHDLKLYIMIFSYIYHGEHSGWITDQWLEVLSVANWLTSLYYSYRAKWHHWNTDQFSRKSIHSSFYSHAKFET